MNFTSDILDVAIKIENHKIELQSSIEDELIARYVFRSKSKGSLLGKRIIALTLLRYLIVDNLGAKCINVNYSLYEHEEKYILGEVSRTQDHYRELNDIKINFRSDLLKYDADNLELNNKGCLLGFTGGKDSTLCYELIKEKYDDLFKFKIDFDDEEFISDYHISRQVLNYDIFNLLSTESFIRNKNKHYYQEEDLHCCFAAPYFNVSNNHPMYLCVGLQFDVVNYYVYENDALISESCLTETYSSIRIFEKLFIEYGLVKFRVVVPLASLSSFAIYGILLNKYGENILRSMNSCWHSNNNSVLCGKCLKCQRVSYIYKIIGMSLSNQERVSAELFEKSDTTIAELFGSKSCEQLTRIYKDEPFLLSNFVFSDDKITYLDHGLNAILSKQFNLETIENPLMKSNIK